MVPQYEKTQYNLPVFSGPFFEMFQHNEGDKRKNETLPAIPGWFATLHQFY